MSDRFCPLPWVSLSLRNNGQYRLCCNANQAADKGLLRGEGGRELVAETHAIADVRNSPLAKAARASMLAGEWHAACVRCREEEAAGVTSRRQVEREIWKDVLDPARARAWTADDGAIDAARVPLAHLDLRFGNRCNLQCRSCNPTESSKWVPDHYRLWGDSYSESSYRVEIRREGERFHVAPDRYDWFEEPHFWRELESRLDGVERLYFAGGEPFLIERHFDFLEACVARGRAANMILEYNTNLTLLPERGLELWPRFRRVQFGVSVDGVGAVNDYIRHPSRFATVARNLHALDRAPGNYVIWLAVTVMAYNILYLPELALWALAQGFRRVNAAPEAPVLNPHPLHGPPFLNVRVFRSDEKARIGERLLARREDLYAAVRAAYGAGDPMRPAARAKVDELIDGYYAFMQAKDLSAHREKFRHFTAGLDRLRAQSFTVALPELAELLSD